MVIKLLIACIICLVSVILLYVLGVLIYSTLSEFKPGQTQNLKNNNKGLDAIPDSTSLSILIWNIGYAGLGKEIDFFYEGGKMVRPDREQNTNYFYGIKNYISSCDTIDFLLFQEIDFNSKRSYKTNQFQAISDLKNSLNAFSAINYKAGYVPVPWTEPMGKVDGGMATFSRYKPSECERISTPGSYSWPKSLFMLKRCFLKSVYSLSSDKNLIIYNIHNSAFDDADELREQELNALKTLITDDYSKGHYVVIGGDWNQNPPGWKVTSSKKYKLKKVWPISESYLPEGWNWAFDPHLPTNRDVTKPFNIDATTCSILDYFVTSPNVEIIQVKTNDLEFEHSDHQPVILTFKLK